jgi:hypothetical protein
VYGGISLKIRASLSTMSSSSTSSPGIRDVLVVAGVLVPQGVASH